MRAVSQVGTRADASMLRGWVLVQARQDFNQVKDIAGQAGRKFSNLAQNFIKDLQGGY